MIFKILEINQNLFLWSGVVVILFIALLSWLIFKYSPVVLKTTLGFFLFSLAILVSSLFIGVIALKNFIRDWEKYEISRLKEGAFVIIERRKSSHSTILERFSENPEGIINDPFAKTILDFLAIGDKDGKIIRANKDILEKVSPPSENPQTVFVDTKDGPYMITFQLSKDKSSSIVVGEKLEMRLIPTLIDMLSAKDAIVLKKEEKSESKKSIISNAEVELGDFKIVIFPQDESIISLLQKITKNVSRGIIFVIGISLVFFAVLSLSYIRKPLLHLINGSEEVERGNFEYEIRYEAKGDIGKLIQTFNNMIKGLRRRDAQIKYRNDLLSAIREVGGSILNEYDKEKIFQICVDIAGTKTNSKCAIFYDGKAKFSQELSVSEDDVKKIQDGEVIVKDGHYIIAYEISAVREGEKIVYGKFVAERERVFIPEEKEFFNSLLNYISSACQRSDYVLKLKLMQSLDSLTGLFNSGFFKSAVKRETSIMKRFQRHYAVVIIEIENSKEIIEKFGYIIWEDIIKSIAIIMRKSVRAYDVAARISQDKFALLLPNTEFKNAKVVEERVRTQIISAPEIPSLPDLELKVKVESFATDNQDPEEIIRKVEEKSSEQV